MAPNRPSWQVRAILERPTVNLLHGEPGELLNRTDDPAIALRSFRPPSCQQKPAGRHGRVEERLHPPRLRAIRSGAGELPKLRARRRPNPRSANGRPPAPAAPRSSARAKGGYKNRAQGCRRRLARSLHRWSGPSRRPSLRRARSGWRGRSGEASSARATSRDGLRPTPAERGRRRRNSGRVGEAGAGGGEGRAAPHRVGGKILARALQKFLQGAAHEALDLGFHPPISRVERAPIQGEARPGWTRCRPAGARRRVRAARRGGISPPRPPAPARAARPAIGSSARRSPPDAAAAPCPPPRPPAPPSGSCRRASVSARGPTAPRVSQSLMANVLRAFECRRTGDVSEAPAYSAGSRLQ